MLASTSRRRWTWKTCGESLPTVSAEMSSSSEMATYWFPAQATVEVETQRQHWRNTHMFTDYKRFAVSTEEKVASK